MLKFDNSLRQFSTLHWGKLRQRVQGSCADYYHLYVRRGLRICCFMIMFSMIAVVFTSATMFMGGCQERVISRSGIGADEMNPRVSEPDGGDRLSNYIWNNKKKDK